MAARTRLGAVLVPPDRLERGWLRTDGGLIEDVGVGDPDRAGPGEAVDLAGAFLAPGLVDLHCHGALGAAIYSGDPDDVRVVAGAHLARGTTTMFGSVATGRRGPAGRRHRGEDRGRDR